MIGRVRTMLGKASAAPVAGGPQPLIRVPQTQQQWNGFLGGVLGPPGGNVNLTQDRAASQIYGGPYQGPEDLDRYGGETPRQRRAYRDLHSSSPVLRAAINGQRDDIAVLEPSITAGNKKNPVAVDAADFVKWTIADAPGGWPGLINNIFIHGSLDGYSILELKMRDVKWNGVTKWGFAYARPLDTTYIKLQLDPYFNVLAVVNMIRGIEAYGVENYLIYTHNGLYNSPFGQSDCRAAITAAKTISDVYLMWYIALKVYGLPYMIGKTQPQNRALMATVLDALRGGGYAVLTNEKDTIDTLDMAAAAATTGFKDLIHTKREDIFFAVRNVAQPFMEGDGGADSHTDTGVQQGSSNAGEKLKAHNITEVVRGQLIPWLVRENFVLEEWEYPQCKLGGTDWNELAKKVDAISKAADAGFDPSKTWAQAQIAMEGATSDDDRLMSVQEKQQAQQAQMQAARPPVPGQPPPAQPPGAPAPPPAKALPPKAFSAGASNAVVWLATARLAADPARFQFRRKHDSADGTVRDLPSEAFDPRKCPPLLVWQDDDGELYVVDGHHRLAWAERDGASRVPVQMIDAESAEEAKEAGRRANMSAAGSVATFSADSASPVEQWADELIAEFAGAAS